MYYLLLAIFLGVAAFGSGYLAVTRWMHHGRIPAGESVQLVVATICAVLMFRMSRLSNERLERLWKTQEREGRSKTSWITIVATLIALHVCALVLFHFAK